MTTVTISLMIYRKMKIPSKAIVLVLLMTTTMSFFVNLTAAFDDFRGAACRTPRIDLEGISPEEVEWYGSITLELVCEAGFDYPFNFNPESSTNIITCQANNRWEPDFLPDCSAEIKPKESKCPNGTVLVQTQSGNKCRGCPLGQFLDPSGSQPSCKPCPKGYYQDHPISDHCKKCPYLENVVSETVWQKVIQTGIDRTHNVLGCPIIHEEANGTAAVFASPIDFSDKMKQAVQNRQEMVSEMKDPSAMSGISSRTRTNNHESFVVLVIVLMNALNTATL